MDADNKEKYKYFASNLIKGLIWLVVIILLFVSVKFYFDTSYTVLMDNIVNRPILIFTVFTFSEIVFGIFPPELFMIWAAHQSNLSTYITYTLLFGLISYAAGATGYFFGLQFSLTKFYSKITSKFGSEMEKNVRKYGGFMIFIAAVTPIPFTAICMLTGASRYNFYKFLLISLSRIVRFAIYGYAVWEVNQI